MQASLSPALWPMWGRPREACGPLGPGGGLLLVYLSISFVFIESECGILDMLTSLRELVSSFRTKSLSTCGIYIPTVE